MSKLWKTKNLNIGNMSRNLPTFYCPTLEHADFHFKIAVLTNLPASTTHVSLTQYAGIGEVDFVCPHFDPFVVDFVFSLFNASRYYQCFKLFILMKCWERERERTSLIGKRA